MIFQLRLFAIWFLKGGDSNNENSESASGEGENKESNGTESGSKRINGAVDPEVNDIRIISYVLTSNAFCRPLLMLSYYI